MISPNLSSSKRMFFIGVSTQHSSIMKVFPLWMKELGRLDVALEGKDLKLHDEAVSSLFRRGFFVTFGDTPHFQ